MPGRRQKQLCGPAVYCRVKKLHSVAQTPNQALRVHEIQRTTGPAVNFSLVAESGLRLNCRARVAQVVERLQAALVISARREGIFECELGNEETTRQ